MSAGIMKLCKLVSGSDHQMKEERQQWQDKAENSERLNSMDIDDLSKDIQR